MKSPLLTLPGAVPAEGVDEGVAAHYGDLFREHRFISFPLPYICLHFLFSIFGVDFIVSLVALLTIGEFNLQV